MTNEVQRFDINGSPGSGKFTLDFDGALTDPPLAYHPPAGDVQRALEALSTVGTGNVVVSKDGNWGYVCSFWNALGDRDLPQLIADDSQLGGGGTITVSTVTEGSTPVPPGGGPQTWSLPTPCSVAELQLLAMRAAAVAPGAHHDAQVTSTATAITVTAPP